jgi:hypothetical protein
MKRFKVYKENDHAIISPYNASWRFYDGKKELFFHEFSNALKYALNDGWFIRDFNF